MADISVIIVTWNSENEVGACVDSVNVTKGGLNIELIIIDNASSDKTSQVLEGKSHPDLQLIKNDCNLGFTKAVNQGIKLSKGKYVLLLNPDTVSQRDAIKKLFDFLETNENYGACAPLMLNEDGTIQYSVRNFPTYWSMYCEFTLLAHIFPKSRVLGKWKMKYFDYSKDNDINQPMAAALMIRKSVLDKIGIMDERFEMFFNDVDLCKRIMDSDLKIRFISTARFVHKKGVSIYKDRAKMIKIWNNDCYKYFEKYHRNILMLLWLKISLKISEFIRILYLKLFR